MFQWDAVDASPNLGRGVKMSSKPSKWLFDIIGGRHTNGIRESLLSLDLFSLAFKNIFWFSYGGGGGAIAALWIRH